MSDYIFKPPPPPPPKAAVSAQPLPQQNNRNGNNRGGNRGRGRGRGGGGGGGGGRGGRSGRGGGGGAGYTVGGPPNPSRSDGAYGHGQSNNIYQQYPPPPPNQQHPPPPPNQQYPPPPSSAAPNVHLNPAFFAPPTSHPAPSPAPLPARPPQLQPTTKNLFFNPHPPTVYTTPLPNPVPSYGHFTLPTPAATSPPSKRQKPNIKPDMDQATWIALNNGNILGTNIKPPQTDAEVAEWIAARKKKFPTAEARARKEVEEQEEREKKIKRDSEMLAKRMERVRQDREGRDRVEEERKRLPIPEIPGEADDDDGPPEELGAKERTVFRDDRHKAAPVKDMPVCRFFKMKGSCGRTGCRYKHELGPKNKSKKGPPAKKTLYQRLLDNDREHENKLMVEVLEYWVETGVLKDEQTTS